MKRESFARFLQEPLRPMAMSSYTESIPDLPSESGPDVRSSSPRPDAMSVAGPVLAIDAPERQTVPLVLSSPHSGSIYPAEFLASAALDADTLRRSEDCYVDDLFGAAPALGAPLIKALFARAFVDPNREPWELDPAMFDSPLPDYVHANSPRVAAGLGTIARIVASGAVIYRAKLSFTEAQRRVRLYHAPYHDALGRLIEETRSRFGCCLLIDCHSMPSSGPSSGSGGEYPGIDIVLGDCHGSSCAPALVAAAESALKHSGFRVSRNQPYAGGYTTQHYGQPALGIHALQIEINRRLYMDETSYRRLPGFADLKNRLGLLIADLAQASPAGMAA
jgi:N-formylglutamate amidohydrolase